VPGGTGFVQAFRRAARWFHRRGRGRGLRSGAAASFTDVSATGGLGVSVETARRTVATALEEAGLRPRDLAFIAPHGNGTQKGDRMELSART
jgi:3-oxoacyl-(acyl-carrier-protein) synthase